MKTTPSYTTAQRAIALLWGIGCHSTFALAITAMALSLFHGMRLGIGPLHGMAAAAANTALLLSFPLSHSALLSTRGRGVLARLAPAGLGRPLSTTTFAWISSIQLLAVFALWSHSDRIWWSLEGPARVAMGIAAAGAWALLVKSMSDAQLSLQTGILGWFSVFRNRAPKFRPFPERGFYRHVRQPIYISFAAVLWLAADGTPDQVAIATLWTAYCVVGSALKERRYLRHFGEAFRRYQARVPFWIPALRRREADAPPPADADVVVIGAGPVGLVLASLLAQRGLRVVVAERRREPALGSMAIGITPPSLAILRHLGLDAEFTRRGVPIDRASVHEDGTPLGELDFSRIGAAHRFILSLPQSETIRILADHVARLPRVRVLRGVEFVSSEPTACGIRATLGEVESGARIAVDAAYLAACDGHRSDVVRREGIGTAKKQYGCRFLMADFADETNLGPVAHLFFGPDGSVESFPLPDRRRRWIVLDRDPVPADGIAARVAARVRERCGHDLTASPASFASSFEPMRSLASRYVRGRIALCGDAAHVMSPIGGQGMNTGFADAAHLADALASAIDAPAQAHRVLARYERRRRLAFRVAAARAARGMWLGTRRGRMASRIRRIVITRILLRPTMRKALAPYFAMLDLPGARELPALLRSATP